MKNLTHLTILLLVILLSCQQIPKQSKETASFNDTINNSDSSRITSGWAFAEYLKEGDSASTVYMVKLKAGLDSIKATINDTTMFIATKGQLILYWNEPHTALIADGRGGYIPPEQIVRVDEPCFKFNFSMRQFNYDQDYELYQSADRKGIDLNSLIKRIRNKDSKALLQFFRLRDVVDGASAEEFSDDFWALINLWDDKELSSFILTLNDSEKNAFCELLIESSYCNPYEYYKLYYPLVLQQINLIK